MITLPKDWADTVGLKKNDTVGLQPQPDGSLVLYPRGSESTAAISTKVIDTDGYAAQTPDRSMLWAVQTPQCFERVLLMRAYARLFERLEAGTLCAPITDDAMVVEQMTGQKVRLIRGKYTNIKITTPEDMDVAKIFLNR